MNTLEQVYREGRLIRHEWSSERDGKQFLCLLTALANDPDVRPESCPAELCPSWLAHLLPWIDDAPSGEAWPGFIERLIPLAPYFGSMTLEQSQRLDYTCRRIAVREARSHCPADETQCLAAIDGVLSLLDRAIAGDMPTQREWDAAEAAAAAAARAAAREAVWAAAAAARAAAAAAREAAREAAWAAAAAARDAADRMIDAMLTAFEQEFDAAAASRKTKA